MKNINKTLCLIGILSLFSIPVFAMEGGDALEEEGERKTEAALLPTGKALVPEGNFFQDVAGMSETEFRKLAPEARAKLLKAAEGSPILKIVRKDGMEFQAGSFRVATIGELAKEAGEGKPSETPLGKFSVVEGIWTGPTSPWAQHVDVKALQAKPENILATFQGASNGNALETTSALQNIDDQFLEGYIYDKTQGPALSISAAPGLIARRYFAYHNPGTPASTWAQTQKTPVNFWSGLADHFAVTPAGYITFSDLKPALDPSGTAINAMGMGIQSFVQVSHGGSGGEYDKHTFLANPKQIVHQVYTAAVDFGGTNAYFSHDPVKVAWANRILDANYLGPVLAGVQLKSHKVVVTMVGGGVFGNQWKHIVASLLRSVSELWRFPIDIELIIYTNGTGMSDRLSTTVPLETRGSTGTKSLREHLLAAVKATKGSFVQYSSARPEGIHLESL